MARFRKELFIGGSIISAGLLTAFLVFSFSSFGADANDDSLSPWIDQAGLGLSAPACGSSNILTTCNGTTNLNVSFSPDGSTMYSIINWSIYIDGVVVCRYTGTAPSGASCGFSGSLTNPTWSGIVTNGPHNYQINVRGAHDDTEGNVWSKWDSGNINELSCIPLPSADIRANDQGGSITITSGSSATIEWCGPSAIACANATSCTVPGFPSGVSGSFSTGPLVFSRTYVLSCIGPGSAGPDLTAMGQTIGGGPSQLSLRFAFDNDFDTHGTVDSSASSYIGQDFGSPKNIRFIRLFRGGISGGRGFHAKLQYSDDAISWTDTNVNNIDILSGSLVWVSFNVNDFGSHRYWRFLDTGEEIKMRINEIEMKEQNPVTDSVTVNVSAANNPPTSNATISKDDVTFSDFIQVTQGVATNVYLRATGSADSDGTITKCEWNSDLDQSSFSVDTTINNPISITPGCNTQGIPFPMTFNDSPGTYTYQVLRITDDDGATDIDSVQVQVNPAPLAASCSVSPTTISLGQSATWTATPTGGVGGYTYSWSGTDGLTGNTQSVVKTYTLAGIKTASVIVISGAQSVNVLCNNSLNVNANLPELTPQNHTINPSGGFDINTTVTFSGRVRNANSINTGTAFAPFNARFCVDSTSATNCLKGINGTILSNHQISTDLIRGGTSLTFTSPGFLVSDLNTHTAYFCVDSGEVINESDETNNCNSFTFQATRPNLQITSFTVPSGAPGSSVNASITIFNNSTIQTASGVNFGVELIKNGSSMDCSTPSDASINTSPLAAGASRNVTIPITLPLTQGGYTAIAMADSNCQITESNEADNTRTTSYAAFPPDYSITPSPDTLIATISGSGNVNSSQTTITVSPFNGFTSTVNLSCPNISTEIPGATCNFVNSTLDSGEYSTGATLYLTIPSSTPEALYNVTIRGLDGPQVTDPRFASPGLKLNIKVRDPGFIEVMAPYLNSLAGFIPEFVKSAFAAF